ncbi:hypothetical protein LINPERHAP1_LOCUS18037, partial [Linum perenne]
YLRILSLGLISYVALLDCFASFRRWLYVTPIVLLSLGLTQRFVNARRSYIAIPMPLGLI